MYITHYFSFKRDMSQNRYADIAVSDARQTNKDLKYAASINATFQTKKNLKDKAKLYLRRGLESSFKKNIETCFTFTL